MIWGSRHYKHYFDDIVNLRYRVYDSFFAHGFELVLRKVGVALGIDGMKYYKRYNMLYASSSKKTSCNIIISGSYFMEWNSDSKFWEYYFKMEEEYYKQEPIVIGINIGPYHTKYFLENTKRLLSETKFLSVRDSKSAEILKELEPVLAPDIILGLRDTIKYSYNKSFVKYVTIIVANNCRENETYIKKMGDILRSAMQYGYETRILRFCDAEGDAVTAKKILDQLDRKVESIGYNGKNLFNILEIINNSLLIIAGRYHGMILGWLFQVKTLPICYSDKMLNTIMDLNSESTFYWMNDLDSMECNINHLLEQITIPKLEESIKNSSKHFAYLDSFYMRKSRGERGQ